MAAGRAIARKCAAWLLILLPLQIRGAPSDLPVGFVLEAHGQWRDSAHGVELVAGREVLQRASVIRAVPSDQSAGIVIYLMDGEVLRRTCNLGSCTSPLTVQVAISPDPTLLQRLEQIKGLFFGPTETEEAAVTLALQRTVEMAICAQLSITQPAPSNTPPTNKTNTSKSPSSCVSNPLYLAGVAEPTGSVSWVAEWGRAGLKELSDVKAAASKRAETDEAVATAVAMLQQDMAGQRASSALMQALTVYRYASQADEPPATGNDEPAVSQLARCTFSVDHPLECAADDSPKPGVYRGPAIKGYVFTIAQEACLADAIADSLTTDQLFAHWLDQKPSDSERALIQHIRSKYSDVLIGRCATDFKVNSIMQSTSGKHLIPAISLPVGPK